MIDYTYVFSSRAHAYGGKLTKEEQQTITKLKSALDAFANEWNILDGSVRTLYNKPHETSFEFEHGFPPKHEEKVKQIILSVLS